MSMGMVLEGVRDWLRDRNEWSITECGVTDDGYPPARAGNFYIAVDEDGVDVGPERTNALTEIYKIEVTVWRRPGHLPKDFLGNIVLPEDRYLPEIKTLHDLERRVIYHLHGWRASTNTLRNFLNTKFNLPDVGRGDAFITELMSTGRGRKEKHQVDDGMPFIGRRLRFRGLMRVQKISNDLG